MAEHGGHDDHDPGHVPQRLRGLAFGFLSTSLGAFSFFAPAIGGLLWKRFFPTLPFIISGVICALAAIPVYIKYRLPRTLPGASAADGGVGPGA